jgi:CRP-like cAMP-binding protein
LLPPAPVSVTVPTGVASFRTLGPETDRFQTFEAVLAAFEGATTQTQTATLDNRLLAALPGDVRRAVQSSLETVRIERRAVIYQPDEPIEYLYLPIDAVISVVTVMRDGAQIEVVTVGCEGITGAEGLLTDRLASRLTWCQVAGEAYRISTRDFRDLCAEQPLFRSLVERYISALLDALAQSIACNRLHYVNERCARWLLMTNDRVGRPEFPLTHEALATMLGVRRAGVSIAASALQQAGYIRYSRGRVTILERQGLESVACECYGAIEQAFANCRQPA